MNNLCKRIAQVTFILMYVHRFAMMNSVKVFSYSAAHPPCACAYDRACAHVKIIYTMSYFMAFILNAYKYFK